MKLLIQDCIICVYFPHIIFHLSPIDGKARKFQFEASYIQLHELTILFLEEDQYIFLNAGQSCSLLHPLKCIRKKPAK